MQVTPASNASLVLARHMETAAASNPRSWDCYRDAFSPAYDEVRFASRDAIALTCAFVEYISDETLTDGDRKLVGMGIRSYGKAYSRGLSLAVGHTDEWEMRQWHLYAMGVARRLLAERGSGNPVLSRDASDPPTAEAGAPFTTTAGGTRDGFTRSPAIRAALRSSGSSPMSPCPPISPSAGPTSRSAGTDTGSR